MILQLNPTIPLWHPASGQTVEAIALIDYSIDHDVMFVCIRRDGEIWTIRAPELRGVENVTIGRGAFAMAASKPETDLRPGETLAVAREHYHSTMMWHEADAGAQGVYKNAAPAAIRAMRSR